MESENVTQQVELVSLLMDSDFSLKAVAHLNDGSRVCFPHGSIDIGFQVTRDSGTDEYMVSGDFVRNYDPDRCPFCGSHIFYQSFTNRAECVNLDCPENFKVRNIGTRILDSAFPDIGGIAALKFADPSFTQCNTISDVIVSCAHRRDVVSRQVTGWLLGCTTEDLLNVVQWPIYGLTAQEFCLACPTLKDLSIVNSHYCDGDILGVSHQQWNDIRHILQVNANLIQLLVKLQS